MSFVQVMSHSGGNVGSDRTPFYGIKTPVEVKKMAQLCKTVDQITRRAILKGTHRHDSIELYGISNPMVLTLDLHP